MRGIRQVKVLTLRIQNFKGVKDLDVSFVGPDSQPRRLTSLLGDNGSGKTTVLQAIALTLSLATRKIASPIDLGWPGFLPERVGTLGAPKISMEATLEDRELSLVQALYREW